jgi:transposase InsO family protein
VRFSWGGEERAAFAKIKDAIVAAPTLAYLDYSREVVLRCDASQVGIGGVLLQRDGAAERPVCFVSRAFIDLETKWSILEQEAFAIVFCVTNLAHYLLGHKFTVEADHRNLVFLDKSTSPKVVRWRLRLQEFDFDIKHIPGPSNVVADGLSRCLVSARRGEGGAEVDRQAEIGRFHGAVVGHRGVRATCEAMKQNGVTWEGMNDAVAHFIASCPTCQKVRLGRGSALAAVRTTAVDEPFSVVAIDAIGPLREDPRCGCKYVVVAVDCFTRFVELIPARDTSAKEAARALLQLFGRYGAPSAVRTDRGTQFTATLIQEFLALVGADQQLTIAHRPESNGLVERANGEVLRHLRSIVMDRRLRDGWVDALPMVQRIVNATVHTSTGAPPARILFGDAINLDRRLFNAELPAAGSADVTTYEDYIGSLTAWQAAVVDASARHQRRVVEERLREGPAAEDVAGYEPGDTVLVSYPGRPPDKLAPRWRGPFVVLESDGDRGMYACQDVRTLKTLHFHESRLKRYLADRTDSLGEVAAVDNEEFVVDSIVDHRIRPGRGSRRGRLEFRIRWAGYEAEEDTWLSYADIRELAALDANSAAHPGLPL